MWAGCVPAVIMVGWSAAAAQATGPPGTVLFQVAYGDRDEQLGLPTGEELQYLLSGPGLVKVDAAGNIWIFDATHNALKLFSRTGRLLRVVGNAAWCGRVGSQMGPQSAPDFEPFQLFTVDGRGHVYILHGAAADGFTVVDCSDRPLVSERDVFGMLIEFGGVEKIVSQLRRRQFPALEGMGEIHSASLDSDHSNNFYVLGLDPEREWRATDGMPTVLYKFDSQLDYIGTRRGTIIGPDGCTYEISTPESDKWISVDMYAPDGGELGTVRLSPPEQIAWQFRPLCVDASRHLYLLCATDRERPRAVRPGLSIDRSLTVLKYDAKGTLLREIEIPGYPLPLAPSCSPVLIDEAENVYYLDLGERALSIRMAGSTGDG